MAEEVSPESKVYVNEKIEKIRKEFKEDLEKAQSKATRTFSTIAMVIGLVTGVSVYFSITDAIQDKLDEAGITKLVESAQDANDIIQNIKTDAENNLHELLKLKSFDQLGDANDYAWVGDIKFVWGTEISKPIGVESFNFKKSFDENCFFVITTLPGYIYNMNKSSFSYQRMTNIDKPQGEHQFWYLAIGH